MTSARRKSELLAEVGRALAEGLALGIAQGQADLLVADLAARYDLAGQGEGTLPASVVRRLHARRAASGKTCERCQERKSLGAFSRHARNPDGLRAYCRNCASDMYQGGRVNAD